MTDNVLVRSALPLVGQLHLLSPRTSDQLGAILERGAGKPRDELRFPVSPAPVPTDLLLYEMPDDPSKKLYIPRYSIAIQNVSGQPRYRILLGEREGGWVLTVHLVKAPAEALGTAARDATEFPHLVQIELDYRLSPGSNARKQLAFGEITMQEEGLQATLAMATLAERDEIFQGLTDPGKEARLVVKRLIDVALPLGASEAAVAIPLRARRPIAGNRPILPSRPILGRPIPPVRPPPVRPIPPVRPPISRLPEPELAFVGKEDYTAGDRRWTRYRLSVTNWNSFDEDFFQPSPDLPPCGANKNASRTWVNIHDGETGNRLYGFCAFSSPASLNGLWFARPQGQQPPATVYISLVDRRANVTRDSNKVATKISAPPTPVFQEVRQGVDNVVPPDPFAFLPELHGYIFDQVTPGSGSDQGLVRSRLAWLDKFHTYLQDPARPHLFYYLPDSFKISRRPDAPFVPFMTVRVQSSAGSPENTDVVLDYVVAPDVDRKRLEAARATLVSQVPSSSPSLELQPFITGDVRFFVDRPTRTGSTVEERSGASLVLQGALKDTLVMKLPDFQVLFDAMIRRTASLFLGRVEVEIPGWDAESIPFSARMDDLAGETFLYAAMAQPGGELGVTITNAIESPVRINSLAATVGRGGAVVPATIGGLDLPVESLAPGENLTATVTPSTPLGATGITTVEFDTSDVEVLPDPEAIWNAILDRSTLEYYALIAVKTFGVLFEPIADRPGDQILAILVEFEGGRTVELSADRLEDTARVDYPIDDVILRRPIDRSYRYRVTVIRADGRQERDAEPRESESTTLFVSVVR